MTEQVWGELRHSFRLDIVKSAFERGLSFIMRSGLEPVEQQVRFVVFRPSVEIVDSISSVPPEFEDLTFETVSFGSRVIAEIEAQRTWLSLKGFTPTKVLVSPKKVHDLYKDLTSTTDMPMTCPPIKIADLEVVISNHLRRVVRIKYITVFDEAKRRINKWFSKKLFKKLHVTWVWLVYGRYYLCLHPFPQLKIEEKFVELSVEDSVVVL